MTHLNKNLIYIVNIDDPTAKLSVSEYAQYSIKTWQWYCDKHGIDLLVVDKNLDPRLNKPIWNKEMIYNFGKGYEKIGIVDSDTMIKWDAPNVFDLIDPKKFYGVNDLCDLNWLMGSIRDRQRFFPNTTMDIFKYINAGVLFFGNENLYVFESLLNLYLLRQSEIESIDGGGKEQTLLNFTLQSLNVDIELLSPAWNLLSIHRKNMFTNNWQLYPELRDGVRYNEPKSFPHFMKYAYVWHFTGFPIEDRISVMSTVWDLIKGNYI